ncbi:MAG: methylated-DNA--[protein]-cysteine S-methyltransferase [Chloroflexi bacterium]|nr:methylated-DNA--[protein]-cysteine S-methyltransferase [Chloroflexota bacterium]
MKYTVFETKMGWMGVIGSARGLRRMTIPLPSPEEAFRDLEPDLGEADLDPGFFGGLAGRMQRFFEDGEAAFPDQFDLPGATPFKKAVWEATRSIPRGETRSYGDIAVQVGRPGGARAVGQVMASNPIAVLVPCHRVIASDGGLGGYGGHLEVKRRLLTLEGAMKGIKRS